MNIFEIYDANLNSGAVQLGEVEAENELHAVELWQVDNPDDEVYAIKKKSQLDETQSGVVL